MQAGQCWQLQLRIHSQMLPVALPEYPRNTAYILGNWGNTDEDTGESSIQQKRIGTILLQNVRTSLSDVRLTCESTPGHMSYESSSCMLISVSR